MMGVWDCRCNECGNDYEFRGPSYRSPGSCDVCGSDDTRIVWTRGSFPSIDTAKDPYDYLDGPIPDSKPIKSFANDRRKGGKDTTG